jgi:outer membrane receptor for monomeric catechols
LTSRCVDCGKWRDPKGGGYSGVPAFGSVLPNPYGELPSDINTGDPGYEVFDRYQRSAAVLLRHAFSDNVTLRSNVRFQNAMVSYDLERALPALQGFQLAINAANLLDKRHVSACPFSNSCYFGASRTVIGTLRYEW